MQLVAYGAQDVYLTGNPQITFFKVVYRRHTNFAMESIQQTLSGDAQPGQRVFCTISRNGDLIHKVWLRAVVPEITLQKNFTQASTNASAVTLDSFKLQLARKMGLALVKSVELEIGGQRIDKHYGDWMNIWNELSLPESKKQGYAKLVGDGEVANDNQYDAFTYGGFGNDEKMSSSGTAGKIPAQELNVPLEFWFCRNPGLALPLIALQYHEVKVNIELNTTKYLGMVSAQFTVAIGATDANETLTYSIGTSSKTLTLASATAVGTHSVRELLSSVPLSSCSLWVDYIYLDTDERRRFAQTSHEYLIEQLQESSESISAVSSTLKLNFNHPVKELIWVAQPLNNLSEGSTGFAADAVTASTTNLSHGQFDYQFYRSNDTDSAQDTVFVASRVKGSPSVYPVNPVVSAKLILNGHDRFEERSGDYFNLVQPFQHHTRASSDKGINVYSFALKPEEHQPSGTCNMSRIDVADLRLTLRNSETHNVRVYAVNYNVLRIMSGMGGLAYAN